MLDRIQKAKDFILSKSNKELELAVVLGSGLGSFADTLENKIEIPYSDIPGFKTTSVKGHKGRLVIGEKSGKTLAIMQGRLHAYEGYDLSEVVFPVRVLISLGIKNVLLTNASGGINKTYTPGDLVVVTDHLNLTGGNPLLGKNISGLGVRFPDMSYAYSKKLNELIFSSMKELGLKELSGIYSGVLGPSYETPAEINMLRTLGGDLVGMSTVFETIAANHMGAQVACISCITNMAAGILDEKLSHDDVKDIAKMAETKFIALLDRFIEKV